MSEENPPSAGDTAADEQAGPSEVSSAEPPVRRSAGPSAEPWWRRRVVLVAVAAAVVLAGGGIFAVRGLGGGPGALPAPRTAAHDPVPAGRVMWTAPANCGVTGATVDALVPHAQLDRVGDGGTCEWSSRGTDKRGGRRLTVTLAIVHAGAGTANAPGGNSSVGAAITRYRAAAIGMAALTGLGDEAAIADKVPGADGAKTVAFRTGNLVATVRYQTESRTDAFEADRTVPPGTVRDAVFRAAADTARSAGAPARPRVAALPAAPARAVFPAKVCDVVPEALRDRLVGTDADTDTNAGDGTADALGLGGAITAPRTASCTWQSDARVLTATITTSDAKKPGVAAGDVAREYLRRYYEARDEPPVSARDPRYFHPLKGLGDLAFCAYLAESAPPGTEAHSPARVVVRVGATLVTVTYGSVLDPYDEGAEAPLTMREAVNGTYAAAGQVVRSLHG